MLVSFTSLGLLESYLSMTDQVAALMTLTELCSISGSIEISVLLAYAPYRVK